MKIKENGSVFVLWEGVMTIEVKGTFTLTYKKNWLCVIQHTQPRSRRVGLYLALNQPLNWKYDCEEQHQRDSTKELIKIDWISESLRNLNHQSGHLLIFSSLSSGICCFLVEKKDRSIQCFVQTLIGSVIKYKEFQRSSAWLITVPLCKIRYRNLIVKVLTL